MKKNYWIILGCLLLGGSYIWNYIDCKSSLNNRVNELFKEEAVDWGNDIIRIKKIYYRGVHDSKSYAKKKKFTMRTAEDTVIISTRFYHPYDETTHIKRTFETSLMVPPYSYDPKIPDSLFHLTLEKEGIEAKVQTELHIRKLAAIFPSEDSMCIHVPTDTILRNYRLENAFVTDSVGIGIANNGLLVGKIAIKPLHIITQMDKWGWKQTVTLISWILMILLWKATLKYRTQIKPYIRNLYIIGNTCIDLNCNKIYLWNGEVRNMIGKKQQLTRMILKKEPDYILTREEICDALWKRPPQDAQINYNVVVKEVRSLLVAEGTALEIETIAKIGIKLLIDKHQLKKYRSMHFRWLLLKLKWKEMMNQNNEI